MELLSTVESLINNKEYLSAYNMIQDLLKIKYDDDMYIHNLLKLQSKCISIDDGKNSIYDKNKINLLNEHFKNKNSLRGVIVTMTTCKRYDLFSQTINSFINCCMDWNLISDFIIIDDNSSLRDRELMKEQYPFIKFIFKTIEQKGHAKSMNMLLDEISKYPKEVKYIFHLEDDWRFFIKDYYLTKLISVLEENDFSSHKSYGQCLLNKCYGEDLQTFPTLGGGYRRYTKNNLRYYIHEYATGEALHNIHAQLATLGFSNCVYWPHYSLRVGITKREVFSKVGKYNENTEHFEREYAYRYIEHYLTTYLDNLYCTHIGRRTYERDSEKINAYDLNNQAQFGEKPKNIEEDEKLELDSISKTITNTNPILLNNDYNYPSPLTLLTLNIKAYVLNLKRRLDRLKCFKAQKESEIFHVFDAVDANLLKPSLFIQKLFENNDYRYRKGIVACAISHILMWSELAMSKHLNSMVIVEDDSELTLDFTRKLLHILSLVKDADLIFLSHHPYTNCAKESDYSRTITPKLELWSYEKSKKESMGGTTAYYITKQGAINLLEQIDNFGLINAIDWEMFKCEKNKVYYCSPFLAFADCVNGAYNKNRVVDSDIQNVHEGVGYDLKTWINEEIKYLGLNCYNSDKIHVENKFEDLLYDNIESVNKMICYTELPVMNKLMENISIMYYTKDLIKKLNLLPVNWVTVDKFIFIIPDPFMNNTMIQEHAFGGHMTKTLASQVSYSKN